VISLGKIETRVLLIQSTGSIRCDFDDREGGVGNSQVATVQVPEGQILRRTKTNTQKSSQSNSGLRLRRLLSLVRRVRTLVRLALQTSPGTIWFNCHYFPLRTAVRLPVLLHWRVRTGTLRGSVEIKGPVHRGMVAIGYPGGVFDEKRSRTIWHNSGKITFCGSARIGSGCEISVGRNARLTIGANLAVNARTTVICRHEITIGEDCMMGWEVLLMDSDLHQIRDAVGRLLNENQPIRLGNHVWIACRCIVLKGATLPDDTVVAAGSTVAGGLQECGQIIGGSPARVLRTNVRWSLEPIPSGEPVAETAFEATT
jgi:acetyltransferase-like isoleucine patch superfamily enzyme